MNIIQRPNKKGDKITFYYDYGRGAGQRPSTGIFIYVKPKDQIQRNHNKEALALLETKKSQLIIEKQAIGSAFIPKHKLRENFLDYYEEYLELNKRNGNRHLKNSFTQFKLVIDRDFLAPIEITENFCKRFRQYLLDKYTGETPGGYYALVYDCLRFQFLFLFFQLLLEKLILIFALLLKFLFLFRQFFSFCFNLNKRLL